MDSDTWRWLIGGGLGALAVGVGWLIRLAYGAGSALAEIKAALAQHGVLHSQHTSDLADHETRIRAAERWQSHHSGETDAVRRPEPV